MATTRAISGTPTSTAGTSTAFHRWSARRILVFGGIALVAAGMIFGDIFAAFVLHPNGDRIGASLITVTKAVTAGDQATIAAEFARIGSLLENRGTKVDSHVHITDFGYVALLLALAQPFVALDERARRRLAQLFLVGAVMLPVGVFLIHYVGLAYSPLSSIGWASIVADFGGLLVFLTVAGEMFGIWRYTRKPAAPVRLVEEYGWTSRALLVGGIALILAGFLFGAWYSAADLYRIEAQDRSLLGQMADNAVAGRSAEAQAAVVAYGGLQAEKAVNIAAHAHVIEFGFLAMLLAFVQPYVYLSEKWRRRWVVVLLSGSVILPVFVRLEENWGLISGGIADFGGVLVIVALLGMLVGVLRYSGKTDSAEVRS